MILGDARDVNILPTVVIEVTDGDAHVVAIAYQSGFLCNVRERAVMVVVEEAVFVFWGLFSERRKLRPPYDLDILIFVFVGIYFDHAPRHLLRLGFFLYGRSFPHL